MDERLLMVKSDTFDEGSETTDRLAKTHSFNTDDDDALPSESRPLSNSNSEGSKLDINSSEYRLKPTSILTHSASIDTLNDQESIGGDVPTEKVKKKRRRTTEQTNPAETRKSIPKKRPWYAKIDYTKPLMYLAFVVLIYLMWVKRDVWIPRLLTSNARIRHTAMLNEQKLKEHAESSQHSSPPSSSSKESSSISSKQDDIDDDDDDDDNRDEKKSFDIKQNLTSSNIDSNTSTTTGTNKSPVQHKLNIRTRRNKMSFSKDPQTKKRRLLRRRAVDGDEIDDIDDDDDTDDIIDTDDDDDLDEIDNDIEDIIIKPIKGKEPILPSSIHTSKKNQPHHHHHHHQPGNTKTSVVISHRVDIVEQLRQLVKSHGKHKDLLTSLLKQTQLDKTKLNKFINKKDFSVITLDVLINFLNSYDSTILIVSK